MPIKFKCPHCQKALSVKEELAGKRAGCPACKKVLTIPAPTAAPADVEALAASALADEPVKQVVKPAETIDFNCPFCDEPLHLSTDQGGKQVPCPECRRIIKVPMPTRRDTTDWRKVEARGPSLARRDDEPAPEGAWGSVNRGTVSSEALEEAGVLPVEREPLTRAQKIRRGLLAGAGVAVLIVGWVMFQNYRTRSLQNRAVDQALEFVKDKKEGLPPEWSAEVYRAVGEYHLLANQPEEAQRNLTRARSLIRAGGSDPSERDALLLDVALTQVKLGGDPGEVDNKTRLKWEEAAKQWRQTLNLIASPPARVAAVREVCRQLIERGQWPLAADLVRWLGTSLGGPVSAQAGAEKKDKKDKAKKEAPRGGVGTQAVALLLALHQPKKAVVVIPAPRENEKGDLVTQLVHSPWIKQGKLDEARRFFAKAPPVERLECLLSIAEFAFDSSKLDDARAGVEEAATIVRAASKEVQTAPALLLQWARLAVRTDQQPQAQAFSDALVEPGLKSRVELEKYRVEVEKGGDLAEDSWSRAVPSKTTLAHALALEEFARHQARTGRGAASDVLDQIGDLKPENVRPLGYVGVALGMQEGNR